MEFPDWVQVKKKYYCNGFGRQVAVCGMLSSQVILQFFGLARIAQSEVVLHDTIFLATCPPTVEKEIHCKLQKTCYTLQPRAATCYDFRKILAVVAESRTALYFVKAQKGCETRFQKGMLHPAT